MVSSELFTPVTEDLRQPDNRFDIVKGLEIANQKLHDKTIDPALASAGVEAGDWVVLQDDDTVAAPSSTAVANTYPVWTGTDTFDSKATGKATIIMGGGFCARSSKYAQGPTYHVGDALTVKDLGGGEKVVSPASGSDPILARVTQVPGADSVMEYLVLNR